MAKQQKGLQEKSKSAKTPSLFGGDFDHLFDEFTRGMMTTPLYRRAVDWEPFRRLEKATGMMTPDIDVTETDQDIRITAELPGMEDKDINVELSGDRLTVRGEKKEEHEETDKDYHVSERRFGSFRRSLRLPDSVDGAKVDARMKNGVLKVILPKTSTAKNKTRKVAIKQG